MRFHVPVGVLEFSCENHVDSSNAQQTLATMDSLFDSYDDASRRDLEGGKMLMRFLVRIWMSCHMQGRQP